MKRLYAQLASQWLHAGLHVCSPALCHSCNYLLDYDETWLCDGCREWFRPPNDLKCLRCNARVGPNLDTADGCFLCKKDHFYFEKVVTLGFYQSQFKDAILRIKHVQGEQLARTLGTLLGKHFSETQGFQPDFITCIPVHWWKRLIKGHNQTESIATGVADVLKKPFINSVLRKVRHTAEQSGLLPTERRKNLRNAFVPIFQDFIQGKKILLVDDVLTTGTTANQASKVLISAGAKTVVVAVLARSFGR
jgi:ComF family protein